MFLEERKKIPGNASTYVALQESTKIDCARRESITDGQFQEFSSVKGFSKKVPGKTSYMMS